MAGGVLRRELEQRPYDAGSVFHDFQPHATLALGVRRKAATVVLDAHHEAFRPDVQRHANLAGSRVAGGVANRFLRDPIQVDRRIAARRLALALPHEAHGDPVERFTVRG